MASSANYVRVGRWSFCLHCKTLNALNVYENHYCAAPWQRSPEGPGIDDASPEMIARVKAQHSGSAPTPETPE